MTSAIDIKSAALPTLERLGVSVLPEVDPAAVAQTWFGTFTTVGTTFLLNLMPPVNPMPFLNHSLPWMYPPIQAR